MTALAAVPQPGDPHVRPCCAYRCDLGRMDPVTTPADPFDAYLREIWRDAEAKLDAALPEGTSAKWDGTPLQVTKVAAYVPLTDDQLMDAGIIPDTRPPVHIPWHRRLRWRWSEWRERVGRKVGGWIAGVDLSERDDW